MKYITFGEPESYEQIEAIGSLYRAIFALADAYGLKDRSSLISVTKGSMEYEISERLDKQKGQQEIIPRVEDLDPEQEDDLTAQKTIITETPDIDLSDVPF